jgi:hypothetical protein
MTLQEQIQTLVKAAPNYGVPSEVMQYCVSPVLQKLGSNLGHLEYFICENNQEDWIVTTLLHRENSKLEKKVIYAFCNEADALRMQQILTDEIITTPIPVAELIFQLFALKSVDSIIFMDSPGNLEKGKEITQDNLLALLEKQLKELQNKQIPPNLA